MKKIFLLFAMAGTLAFTSCNNDDDYVYQDNDTIAESFQLNIDFQPDNEGLFSVLYPLDPVIYDSDVVLAYRRAGSSNGATIWEPIPRTIYLADGNEVDYDFNFTYRDILFYMGATFDLGTSPEFTQNQTFRVVIIPAYDSTARMKDPRTMTYEEVAAKYGIKESDVKIMN